MNPTCEMTFEGYPHPGCAEFAEPDTWGCPNEATTLIIYDDPQSRWEWEKYGPFTQEEIDRSDGHLSHYTFQMLVCSDHVAYILPDHEEEQYPADNIYIERW